MNLSRLFALTALAVVAVAAGPAAAPATTCPHTNVVFYTTDTTRLATELGASASSCADYYLSITPAGTAGLPRGGLPVTTIHALGPHFHAMAEIRLNAWTPYATANGWYAAGLEVRRQMTLAGYDASLGDTWAVNEVGEPSGTAMGVAVVKNTGTARQDLRDFVHGMYAGVDGTPDPGLVFAADPLQVTSDLSQYKQDLQSWYSDSAFWNDMSRYVHFWGQETYADARNWGVAGSTLAQRAAYLADYFEHGKRLAAAGDGSTDAARAFFAAAYTPIGNAAFRQPIPNQTTGIGFGYTDIGLTGMQNFVSTQAYALRSDDQFGFAVVPLNATAAETLAVEDRVAGAIHDSETSPIGACGATSQWCDTTVAGAQFNDAWKTFANTLEGSNVQVQIGPAVTVTFSEVDLRGATEATSSTDGPPAPPGFQARPGTLSYDIETTATFAGPVDVCLAYDPASYAGYAPHLFALVAADWSDVTTTVGPSTVCGRVSALGTFAVFAGDPTPPTITPHVTGPLGMNGWYIGDVTVTWDVADAQSQISTTSGCDTTTITADTAATTLTCSATSDGGTAAVSVTVKRDATPPTVTCTPTPSTLWPPNGKLVPVTVAVTVADATSGPAGFTLTTETVSSGSAATDIVGFDLGTSDVAGFLRAERSGTESKRPYELTYTAQDVAGNTATCVATVVVPHDQRDH